MIQHSTITAPVIEYPHWQSGLPCCWCPFLEQSVPTDTARQCSWLTKL